LTTERSAVLSDLRLASGGGGSRPSVEQDIRALGTYLKRLPGDKKSVASCADSPSKKFNSSIEGYNEGLTYPGDAILSSDNCAYERVKAALATLLTSILSFIPDTDKVS
jgi:hypothetical protein